MTEMSANFEERVWVSMDRLYAKMDDLAEQVKEIREAQIRTEAQDHSGNHDRLEAKLHKLEAKIYALEAQDAKQTGVTIALEWAYKLGPWIAVTIIAVKNGLSLG